MNHILQKLSVGAALAALMHPASALELNFDDLVDLTKPPGQTKFFAAPYQGFNFPFTLGSSGCECAGSWYWSDRSSDVNNDFKSSPVSVSTEFSRVNGNYFYGESLPIATIGGPVRVDGAWFTSYDDIEIRFNLYYQGAIVARTDFTILYFDSPPVYLPTNYFGPVDKITVEGYQGYFTMDNFTYEPVPEPGTHALMMAGLIGLGMMVRRRLACP